jgi:hypothetical protein
MRRPVVGRPTTRAFLFFFFSFSLLLCKECGRICSLTSDETHHDYGTRLLKVGRVGKLCPSGTGYRYLQRTAIVLFSFFQYLFSKPVAEVLVGRGRDSSQKDKRWDKAGIQVVARPASLVCRLTGGRFRIHRPSSKKGGNASPRIASAKQIPLHTVVYSFLDAPRPLPRGTRPRLQDPHSNTKLPNPRVSPLI